MPRMVPTIELITSRPLVAGRRFISPLPIALSADTAPGKVQDRIVPQSIIGDGSLYRPTHAPNSVNR